MGEHGTGEKQGDRETRSIEIDRANEAAAHSMPNDEALERALLLAAEAGRFDVVAQIARELEARRLAHQPNVVALSARRGAP